MHDGWWKAKWETRFRIPHYWNQDNSINCLLFLFVRIFYEFRVYKRAPMKTFEGFKHLKGYIHKSVCTLLKNLIKD